MSFALNQEIATLEEKLQSGVNQALSKRLKVCYAQRDAELTSRDAAKAAAKATTDAQMAKAAKKFKVAKGPPSAYAPATASGKSIGCCDCKAEFFFSEKDQAFFTQQGFAEPVRCTSCRAAKKAKQRYPLTISCCGCSNEFVHTIGAQLHYEESGFEPPIRCAPCRAAKKASHVAPIRIKCTKCETDFTFSAGAQKFFKEKGWAAPTRCAPCRKLNKSENTSVAEADVAAAEAPVVEPMRISTPPLTECISCGEPAVGACCEGSPHPSAPKATADA